MLNKVLFTFFLIVSSLNASWSEYKTHFIAQDGRIIDRVNNNITHSEGVGYAMYFAIKNKDIKYFTKIHTWYQNNLIKNKFGLISWKWGKDNNSWHVLDKNNATDGDLWIAYDNLLAYELTKEGIYKQEALQLISKIKQHLILKQKNKVYLLPAQSGFEDKNSFEINLSYYLFFIFDKFYQYDKDNIWKQLKKDGINLLYKARFSTLHLNADWIKIDKKTNQISLSRNHLFGFDAIRIPYNILKSDIKEKKKLLSPYKNYMDGMKQSKVIFGVSDLKNGTISIYNYSFAHLSIYNMIDKYFYKTKSFTQDIKKLQRQHKDDYYSYSIYLFSITN